jgi:hypothetical protein
MIIRRIYLFWCVFFCLAGCSLSGDDTTDLTRGETAAAPGEAEYHDFQQLEGRIGAYPIRMNLMWSAEPGPEEVRYFSGSYYYQRIRQPIQISGVLRQDTLVIREPGRLGREAHRFKLIPDGSAGYTGVWINGNTGRSLPVQLQPRTEAAFRFAIREVVDSIRLYPEADESPRAQFSLVWLEADSEQYPEQAAFVNQVIHRDILGLDSAVPTQRGVLARRDTFFYYYREDAAAIGPPELGEGYSAMLNYDHSAQLEVIYVSDSLVSLALMEYDYSGGAHGNYGTRLFTIDLRANRLLTLADVLRGNYEPKLVSALGTAAREYFELGRDDALSVVLFEDAVHPTENFALTPAGLLFDYPPYDIAAYAVGEVQLFVPFKRIQAFLQPAYRYWQ